VPRETDARQAPPGRGQRAAALPHQNQAPLREKKRSASPWRPRPAGRRGPRSPAVGFEGQAEEGHPQVAASARPGVASRTPAAPTGRTGRPGRGSRRRAVRPQREGPRPPGSLRRPSATGCQRSVPSSAAVEATSRPAMSEETASPGARRRACPGNTPTVRTLAERLRAPLPGRHRQTRPRRTGTAPLRADTAPRRPFRSNPGSRTVRASKAAAGPARRSRTDGSGAHPTRHGREVKDEGQPGPAVQSAPEGASRHQAHGAKA